MGLLSGLMGNASQKNVDKVERDLEDILVPGEQVTLAFSLIRDLIVFTEFRLILVDKQGVTERKRPTNPFLIARSLDFQSKLPVILIWMPN